MDHSTRIKRGRDLGDAYEKLLGDVYDSAEEMLIDMLADLHHAWPMINIVQAAWTARMHYNAEKLDSEQERKAKFADKVLMILQEHRDWSADTTEAISSFAIDDDLAFTDSEGFFHKKGD